jgi:hypothetical protein
MIFDCVKRSSDLEMKRVSAFASTFLCSFMCLSLWNQMNLFLCFFFFFLLLNSYFLRKKIEFYENPTTKKMVFALLILHLKSSVLLSLSTTVSQVRERVDESGSSSVVVYNSRQQLL